MERGWEFLLLSGRKRFKKRRISILMAWKLNEGLIVILNNFEFFSQTKESLNCVRDDLMKCGEGVYNIFIKTVENSMTSSNGNCKLDEVSGSSAFLAVQFNKSSTNFNKFKNLTNFYSIAIFFIYFSSSFH